MLLKEILNKNVIYDIVKQNASTFSTMARIGSRDIKFTASINTDDEWAVEFTEYQANDRHSKGTYKKTGSGNELEVFSMIKASIEEFIELYNPKEIYFTSEKSNDSDSRSKLYDRMMSRFKIPGYTYHQPKNIDEKVSLFKLIRND